MLTISEVSTLLDSSIIENTNYLCNDKGYVLYKVLKGTPLKYRQPINNDNLSFDYIKELSKTHKLFLNIYDYTCTRNVLLDDVFVFRDHHRNAYPYIIYVRNIQTPHCPCYLIFNDVSVDDVNGRPLGIDCLTVRKNNRLECVIGNTRDRYTKNTLNKLKLRGLYHNEILIKRLESKYEYLFQDHLYNITILCPDLSDSLPYDHYTSMP